MNSIMTLHSLLYHQAEMPFQPVGEQLLWLINNVDST